MQSSDGHKVFVGDLPGDITDAELQAVFSTYGEVKNIHLMQPHAKTGQRCALLFYANMQSAEDAIKVLNGVYKIREDATGPIKVAWPREKGAVAPDPSGKIQEPDGFKLFVGGLPTDCREEEVRLVFATYGEVTRVHIMMPKDGATRVAAFVYYAKAESGDDAISVLNDQYKIRADAEQPIQVKWAAPKNKGDGKGQWDAWGGGGGGGGGGGSDWNAWGGKGGEPQKIKQTDGWKLFVGGLPMDCTEAELQTVFATYGEVTKCHVMPPHGSSGRVAAFVYYATEQAGDDAVKVLNGLYKIRQDADAPIQVKWATEKSQGGGKGDFGKGDFGKGDYGKGGSSWSGGGGGYGYDKGGSSKGYGKDYGKGGGKGWDQGWGGKGDGGWGKGDWSGGGKGGWDSGYGGGKDSGYGGGKDSGYGKGGGKNGGGKSWGKDGGKGGGELSDTKLFVGNLPDDITEDALKYVFGNYGSVTNVHVMTGKSKTGNACAFVEYAVADQASTAIATLHEKYEIKPGYGQIMVRQAQSGGKGEKGGRPAPY